MWDFSIGQALGLMVRTAPFVLFRVIVYFAIAVALMLVTGTGAGVGYGVGALGDEELRAQSTAWGAMGGFGLTAGIIFFFRDYLLYIVKAGHIAVMVEVMQGRDIPGGQGQIAYAKSVVAERFGTASALFGLDRLIKGVVGAITGLVQGLLMILPIPGLDRIIGLVRAYLKMAVGLVDEVILAHLMATRAPNPWKGAQEALVLYGQNARPMMINAAWLTAIVWLLSFVVFVVMLAPAAALMWLIPGEFTAGTFLFAVVFAWAVKAALIEPFAIACMIQVFFKVTAGQTPNPEWEARLAGASEKFKEMGNRAMNWAGRGFGAGATKQQES
ncbi:MAG: hypothetical protein K9G71_07910 [Rhodobacteraceae bacterium]|nr:hypothetical protein [Paracoccaceae bacterium]MCF8514270.1 hypothetical protein [Paracoccaceae bacterium]MCF8518514.1 hypothetical protein [Paracoccaceae bacterium]